MSKPTNGDSVLETLQPLEPLFSELSDVVNADGLYVECERVESTEEQKAKTRGKGGELAKAKHVQTEVVKPQSGDKSSTALPVRRCETPLPVDVTARCGGVTDISARRRSKDISAGDVFGDSVCGKPSPVLSPYELVNQKTKVVKRIINEKKTLMANILQISSYDYNTISEVVDEVNDSSDPRELLFASITQADTLSRVINKRIATEHLA